VKGQENGTEKIVSSSDVHRVHCPGHSPDGLHGMVFVVGLPSENCGHSFMDRLGGLGDRVRSVLLGDDQD